MTLLKKIVAVLGFVLLATGALPILAAAPKMGPLCLAAYQGRKNEVVQLLKKGADPNRTDKYGQTALDCAISGHHLDITKLLLENGANPNDPKQHYLIRAADDNNFELVKLLLEHGAKVNTTRPPFQDSPLVGACASGNEVMAKLLVEHGAKLNEYWKYSSPLMAASGAGPADLVKYLMSRGADLKAVDTEGETAIYYAVRGSQPGVAGLLLKAGIKQNVLNTNGYTPLMVAARLSRIRVMRVLIENGADLDLHCRVPSKSGMGFNGDSRTALMIACQNGAVDSVRELLKAGASKSASDTGGRNALHYAAAFGRTRSAELLLRAGAKVNACDQDGKTALMCAAMDGFTDCVKMLLRHGADASIKDQDGKTALDYARKLGDPYLENALKYPKTK